jgi:hypothetical protein
MDIPAAQQDQLFRRLPIEFAAKLAEILPCYDVYVLLHARSSVDIQPITESLANVEMVFQTFACSLG